MEENDRRHRHLRRPFLLPTTATAASSDNLSSNSTIILRLSLVALIGIVSIWANHEASKGYAVTILNESGNTFPGKRFQLFYVSNDKATRLVLKASQVVESFLYPDCDGRDNKKPVKHIVLKLTDSGNDDVINVDSGPDHDEFVLRISPLIMKGTYFDEVMVTAVGRGVARIWLWDGLGNAPKSLVDGIVEYILTDRLGGLWGVASPDRAEPPESAVVWLRYCERRRPGFIRRLNRAMKDGWNDRMLDGALGLPVEDLCTTYRESLRYNISSV